MAVEIRITNNLPEVLGLFNTALSQALLDIGLTVEGDAAANSPVRTGALRGSWVVDVNEGESSVTIGVPMDALKGNYAKYVELGTSRMVGRHMLGNALNARLPEFSEIVETKLKNA